jgi:class 3 adenylate cyclase
MKSRLNSILQIGDRPDDPHNVTLMHHFLVSMGVFMSFGGLIWGSMTLAFGLVLQSLIPYSYVLLTIINFLFFARFKNFQLARSFQVLISLLLPFFFQWSLGGFVVSGAVMLWAMLALAAAFTFQSTWLNVRWLAAFLALTVVSGVVEPYLSEVAIEVPQHITTLFFVLNIFIISSLVFGLNIYFMSKKDELQEALFKAEKDKAEIAGKLAKYLSPQVYDSIFAGDREVKIESYRKKLTVFFSDIKDFTRTTDRMESEALTGLLNEYLNEMSKIALEHGGTIDKYIGDAIMIFFGDPESRGSKKDALACASMALAMRTKMKYLRENWLEQGIANPLHVRMGINTGYCTVGNIGSEDRMDYTIIGGEVNLASRLESLAQEDSILISYETYALIKDQIKCEEKQESKVKGIAYPVRVFEVSHSLANLDIGPSASVQHDKISEQQKGFRLELDLNKVDRTKVKFRLQEVIKSLESPKEPEKQG